MHAGIRARARVCVQLRARFRARTCVHERVHVSDSTRARARACVRARARAVCVGACHFAFVLGCVVVLSARVYAWACMQDGKALVLVRRDAARLIHATVAILFGVHNYVGHNYVGHSYVGLVRACMRVRERAHTCVYACAPMRSPNACVFGVHNYVGHNYTCHDYICHALAECVYDMRCTCCSCSAPLTQTFFLAYLFPR